MKSKVSISLFRSFFSLICFMLIIPAITVAQVEIIATGSGGNFTITNYPGNWSAKAGVTITFKANHTIPGPATLTVGGVSRNIYKQVSQPLASGDILSGQEVTVTFDGTNFQMMSNLGSTSGSVGSGTANYVTRWLTSSTLGTSTLRDDGTGVAINAAPFAASRFYINNTGSTIGFEMLNTSSAQGMFITNDPTAGSNALRIRNNANTTAFELEQLNSSTTNPGMYLQNSGAGIGLLSEVYGSGSAGSFIIQNATNASAAFTARTFGTGNASQFFINNASNVNSAISASSTGSGPAVIATMTGTGQGARISLTNAANSSDALYVSHSGTGLAGNFLGKVSVTSLQVTNGAVNGNVLTSDASGNATWQPIGTAFAWGVTGNSGLNAATNFLGTTDNSAVVFRTNNTEAMRLTVAQNLLLGTTTNDGRLTVAGNTTGSGANAISVKNSIGDGMFFVRNDKTSGFGFGPSDAGTAPIVTIKGQTADNTGWGLNVTDNTYASKFAVRNDGRVGIGTDAPTHKFTVKGNAGTAFDGPQMAFYSVDNYPDFSTLMWNHGEQWLMFNADYNGSFISSSPTANFAIHTENYGLNQLRFDYASGIAAGSGISWIPGITLRDNGLVGIGTSSPSEKLDVSGSIRFTGSLLPNGISGSTGQVLTSAGAGGTPTWTTISGLSGGTTNYIPKWTGASTLSSTSLLYDNGSNIGVKTTTPAADVHIHESTAGVYQLRISNNTTGQTSTDGFTISSSSNDVNITQHENADMLLGTNNTLRMTLKGSGNVAVGSSITANARLDVQGDFAMREVAISNTLTTINNLAIGANSFVMLSGPTSNFTITGIANGVDGKVLTLYNTTVMSMTISNENALSTVGNRILTGTGASITVSGEGSVTLMYSTSKLRWLVVGFSETPNGAGPWSKTGGTVSLTTSSDLVTIGNVTASEKLTVEGFMSAKSTGSSGVVIDKGVSTDNAYLVYRTGGGDRWTLGMQNDENYSIYNWAMSREDMTVLYSNGNVGFGTTTPVNRVDVEGNMAIGSTYSGTSSAPPNGLIVEGNVGIGTIGVGAGSGYKLRVESNDDETNAGYFYNNGAANTTKIGVQGRAQGTGSGLNYGVYADASGAGTGDKYGIYSYVYGTSSLLQYGIRTRVWASATGATKYGGYFEASGGATQNRGIYADVSGANSNYGIYADVSHAANVGYGLYSLIDGSGTSYGLYVDNNSTSGGTGVYSNVTNTATTAAGRFGYRSLAYNGLSTTYGLYAATGASAGNTAYGVYSFASNNSGTFYAGYFSGNVTVTGTLSKGGGSFKIDDPRDPENKYLSHSFVESPDMMNVYNGNVTTDASGYVTVTLPDYFSMLNKDFRYQLTVMGGDFANAIISRKVDASNTFVIRTDKPNTEVSWQVTGIRKDPWAEKNRIIVEQEKPASEKGTYLNPELYNQPKSKGLGYSKEAEEDTDKDTLKK